MHKDDYVNLKIRSSYLLLPTDNQYHFAFNDVTFTKPTEEEFVNLVLQRIKTKNERANQYDKLNVKWLELIISDENGYFDDGSVLSKTNQQKLIDEVKKSKFQTVYILSTYKGIGSLQVIGDIPKFLLKNNL